MRLILNFIVIIFSRSSASEGFCLCTYIVHTCNIKYLLSFECLLAFSEIVSTIAYVLFVIVTE